MVLTDYTYLISSDMIILLAHIIFCFDFIFYFSFLKSIAF